MIMFSSSVYRFFLCQTLFWSVQPFLRDWVTHIQNFAFRSKTNRIYENLSRTFNSTYIFLLYHIIDWVTFFNVKMLTSAESIFALIRFNPYVGVSFCGSNSFIIRLLLMIGGDYIHNKIIILVSKWLEK